MGDTATCVWLPVSRAIDQLRVICGSSLHRSSTNNPAVERGAREPDTQFSEEEPEARWKTDGLKVAMAILERTSFHNFHPLTLTRIWECGYLKDM